MGTHDSDAMQDAVFFHDDFEQKIQKDLNKTPTVCQKIKNEAGMHVHYPLLHLKHRRLGFPNLSKLRPQPKPG